MVDTDRRPQHASLRAPGTVTAVGSATGFGSCGLYLGILLLSLAIGLGFPACEGDENGGSTPDGSDGLEGDTTGDAVEDDSELDTESDVDDQDGADASPDDSTESDIEPDIEPETDTETDAEPDAEGDEGSDTSTDGAGDAQDEDPLPVCIPEPTPESFQVAGPDNLGSGLSPGGRDLTPAGTNLAIEGFPSDVILTPDGRYALVTSTSSDDRRLVVVDIEEARIVQDIDRDEASFGLAISSSGDRVWASGGAHLEIDYYAMAEDGTLTYEGLVEVGGYPTGLALSPDDATLWVGLYSPAKVVEIDTATLAIRREIVLAEPAWDVLHLPGRAELYVSTLPGNVVSVLNLESGEVQASIEVGQSPAGMASNPDESRVWVAVSGTDRITSIDTATRAIMRRVPVAENDLVDGEGWTLPNSNVNDVVLDDAGGRLYASRGADNAVTVLDAGTMAVLGSLPTAWYPTGVAVSQSTSTLVIIEGKGFGSGPSYGHSSKQALTGSITLVDLGELDLEATSEAVVAQYNRPTVVFPFECEGTFPIPTDPGQRSPIEYVMLVVKENKTFDCVFGDLTDMDVDADPSLVRFGEEITPNQHELARQFAFSDNFYTEVETSDMGHTLLTATHMTEFVERIWTEANRMSRFQGYQIDEAAVPAAGNFFTHLIDHGVEFRVFGEIVGMFAETADGTQPFDFTDWYYPGGPVFSLEIRDEERARYLAGLIDSGDVATFSFILLPNDHTQGTREGAPTPESMVADNDYGLGIFLEALSHSPYWEKSAVFIVEDDPQGCYDHVDTHRSFLTVVSPWARRGYVSHVNASFVSVHATIERILGIPPLGRPDASASPLWDLFTGVPDFTPYTALPRQVPEELNSADTVGAEASLAMDFRSPDRNPDMVIVLDAYRLWRMGRISREEADRRVAERFTDEHMEAIVEEAQEEAIAFESAFQQYEEWLRERGRPVPELRLGPERP